MKTIKELIKNNGKDTISIFSHAIAGVLYYTIKIEDEVFQYPVDMNDKDDVGTATFLSEFRSITLMRYIRKAIESNNLIKIK